MNRPAKTRRRQRGNAMVEFGLAAAVLAPIFAGTFQYGYTYYLYNNLQSSVRAAARYAATRPYDETSFAAAVRNMAVYGDAAGGTQSIVPNLTPDHISVRVAFSQDTPTQVTVEVINYRIDGLFGRVTLNGKPRVTFPYLGSWDPV